jgi:peptide-methionine (S)-S-oxide reductase
MLFFKSKADMPTAATALPGRSIPIPTAREHHILKRPLAGPYPDGIETAMFGMGCFWGAERKFWQIGDGIWITAVGYAAGITPNPTYEEVCSGRTGHNEVVLVAFDPKVLPYRTLLTTFFEAHDPTQGMRQGNDRGTQYRSGIYTYGEAQAAEAKMVADAYGPAIAAKGYGPITTEIMAAPAFYFAEDYHQQYLAKVPHGYCGLRGTGVACQLPTGVAV